MLTLLLAACGDPTTPLAPQEGPLVELSAEGRQLTEQLKLSRNVYLETVATQLIPKVSGEDLTSWAKKELSKVSGGALPANSIYATSLPDDPVAACKSNSKCTQALQSANRGAIEKHNDLYVIVLANVPTPIKVIPRTQQHETTNP